MRPEIWGPKFWFVIHITSFRYPNEPTEDQKHIMKSFIYNIANQVLPCAICRGHMKQYLKENSKEFELALNNGQDYVKFMWKFHNSVNLRTGKTEMSFEQFKNKYEKLENIGDIQLYTEKYLPYIIGIIIGIGIGYILSEKLFI